MKALRILILLTCLILTATYSFAVAEVLFSLYRRGFTRDVTTFLIGGGIFLVVWFYFYDFWKNWMGIFTHELTHSVACVLSFSRLVEFVVKRGHASQIICESKSSVSMVFIALSPYFLPIFTTIPAFLIPFFKENYIGYLFGVIGFTTAYHLAIFLTQFRPYQPDLKRAGLVASTIYIVLGNVFFIGLVLALVDQRYAGAWRFTLSGFYHLFDWLGDVAATLPVRITSSK